MSEKTSELLPNIIGACHELIKRLVEITDVLIFRVEKPVVFSHIQPKLAMRFTGFILVNFSEINTS